MRRSSATMGLLALACAQCGRTPITSERLEGAIGPTFAGLVHVQLTRLHMPAPLASDIHVIAKCHKVKPASAADGPGEWACTFLWTGPHSRGTLRDTFAVTVLSDGCYTATAEGEDAHVGGPTLVGSEGERVTNLLYAFEGCFDTTG